MHMHMLVSGVTRVGKGATGEAGPVVISIVISIIVTGTDTCAHTRRQQSRRSFANARAEYRICQKVVFMAMEMREECDSIFDVLVFYLVEVVNICLSVLVRLIRLPR